MISCLKYLALLLMIILVTVSQAHLQPMSTFFCSKCNISYKRIPSSLNAHHRKDNRITEIATGTGKRSDSCFRFVLARPSEGKTN